MLERTGAMLLCALRLWGWRRALICAPRMSARTLVATGCLKPVCAACLIFGKYGVNETARLPCTVSQKQNLTPDSSYYFLSVASLATRKFEKKASVTGRGGKTFLTIFIIEWCLRTQVSLFYCVVPLWIWLHSDTFQGVFLSFHVCVVCMLRKTWKKKWGKKKWQLVIGHFKEMHFKENLVAGYLTVVFWCLRQ